jgi:hypothetical protein
MEAMKPRFSRTNTMDSTASQKTMVDSLSGTAPSLKKLLEFTQEVKNLEKATTDEIVKKPAIKRTQAFSAKVKAVAKLANPLKVKSNFLEKFTAQSVEKKVIVDAKQPSSWHVQRTFNEVALTQEGVQMLQNDPRISRRRGALVGAGAGWAVGTGIALGATLPLAPLYAPAAVPAIVLPMVGGTIAGAAIGAKIGLPLGKRSSIIRTHGLYYVVIVGSKLESRLINGKLLGDVVLKRYVAGTVSKKLQEAVEKGSVRLTPSQINDIETYYQYAANAFK